MSDCRIDIWKMKISPETLELSDHQARDTITALRLLESNVRHLPLATPDPVPTYEAEVQALRYLRGMLQIIQSESHRQIKDALINQLNDILSRFYPRIQPGHTAMHTYWLADEFARAIQTHLAGENKHAEKQLTMARDLGVLLEHHHAVCTVSETENQITTQKSTLCKIEPNKKIIQYATQPWFNLAKESVGFANQTDTWLDHFFKAHANDIANLGIPAPPSARWLPIPANVKLHEIAVHHRDHPERDTCTHLISTAALSPFEIADHDEQQKIANATLLEIISLNLEKRIAAYRKLYHHADDENIVFFVSYQTLLSPLPGEEVLPHKDNSARFITTTKETMRYITQHPMWKEKFPHVSLAFYHTNAAINKHAGVAKIYHADKSVRQVKIFHTKETLVGLIISGMKKQNPDIDKWRMRNDLHRLDLDDLLKMIKDHFPPPFISNELMNELTHRTEACLLLQKLLGHHSLFHHLSVYQRNIMMAALEFHAMGHQALLVVGCKSARDRTAIFLSAVKTMLENPEAMQNWDLLFKGIIASLNQGHHFRSMHFHSAIVKVAAVHKDFMSALSESTQQSILALLPFAKKLKPHPNHAEPAAPVSHWPFFPRPSAPENTSLPSPASLECRPS